MSIKYSPSWSIDYSVELKLCIILLWVRYATLLGYSLYTLFFYCSVTVLLLIGLVVLVLLVFYYRRRIRRMEADLRTR